MKRFRHCAVTAVLPAAAVLLACSSTPADATARDQPRRLAVGDLVVVKPLPLQGSIRRSEVPALALATWPTAGLIAVQVQQLSRSW
jgi:hypothetical protein